MGKKRKFNDIHSGPNAEITEEVIENQKIEKEKYLNETTFTLGPKIGLKRNINKRLIVVLEKANLESVKQGHKYELLNCDDHTGLMKKYKKDTSICRPDILHQCLLMLQDSPLNQAGLLQVYIHTDKNVLIEVHPQCRIPRTFRRFAGLMVQLLHKFSVRSSGGPNMKLLKVIKNPVEEHLPVGCKKIGTSFTCTKLINPRELVPKDDPIVIVIGSMAHGKVEASYVEEEISISKYHLSAALTCAKICSGFEEVWGVQ